MQFITWSFAQMCAKVLRRPSILQKSRAFLFFANLSIMCGNWVCCPFILLISIFYTTNHLLMLSCMQYSSLRFWLTLILHQTLIDTSTKTLRPWHKMNQKDISSDISLKYILIWDNRDINNWIMHLLATLCLNKNLNLALFKLKLRNTFVDTSVLMQQSWN